MKTPVNARTLKHHFTYNWWMYLMVVLVSLLLVPLVFDVTEPPVPEEKKVLVYIYGLTDEEAFNAYMESVRLRELPEMESMHSVSLVPDDTYGSMQLVTYMAAHEGDLYILPRDEFLSFASSGAFVPLEDDEVLMSLFSGAGVDLKRGWRTLSDSDERHLYGIPADTLPGLGRLCYVNNGYLAVMAYGGNTENTMVFFRALCRDMLNDPEAAATETDLEPGAVPVQAAP